MLKRVARDGLIVFGGQVLSALAVLASVRVLTEALAPAAYGLMAILIGVASTANSVLIWPVGQVVMVTYPRFRADGRGEAFRDATAHVTGRIIWWATAVLTLLGGPILGLSTGDWTSGWFLGPLFLLEARRYVSMTLMMASGAQRKAAAIYVTDSWLRLGFAFLAIVLFGSSVLVAIAGTVGGAALVTILLSRGARGRELLRRAAPRAPADPESLSVIRARAAPLVPSAMLANVNEMGGRYLVAGIAGLASAGIYSAALSLVRRPFGMLNSVTDWSLKPAVAEAVAGGETRRTGAALRAWLLLGVGAACLLATVIVIAREPIVRLLLAAEYHSAISLLPWFAGGMLFLNAANVLNGMSLVLGDAKATLASSAVAAAATLVATYALVTGEGLRGAAIAVAVAYGCQLLVSAFLAVRRYRGAVSPIARRASES